jgi:hypothetical protein
MISFTIGFAVPDVLYMEQFMIPLDFQSFDQYVTFFLVIEAVVFDERYIAAIDCAGAFEIDLDFTFVCVWMDRPISYLERVGLVSKQSVVITNKPTIMLSTLASFLDLCAFFLLSRSLLPHRPSAKVSGLSSFSSLRRLLALASSSTCQTASNCMEHSLRMCRKALLFFSRSFSCFLEVRPAANAPISIEEHLDVPSRENDESVCVFCANQLLLIEQP